MKNQRKQNKTKQKQWSTKSVQSRVLFDERVLFFNSFVFFNPYLATRTTKQNI